MGHPASRVDRVVSRLGGVALVELIGDRCCSASSRVAVAAGVPLPLVDVQPVSDLAELGVQVGELDGLLSMLLVVVVVAERCGELPPAGPGPTR